MIGGSWRDSFVRPTRQYLAGVCAGFGLGLVIGSWLSWGWHPALVIPGFAMIALGASVARAAQRAERQHGAGHG